MTIGLFILSCAVALGAVICAILINRYHRKSRRYIQILLFAAAFANAFNGIGVIARQGTTALICYTLCFIAVDLFGITLLFYAYHYARFPQSRWIGRALALAAGVYDMGSLIVNIRLQNVFECKRMVLPDGRLYYRAKPVETETGVPLFQAHILFVYLLLSASLAVFIVKLVRAYKLYRERYAGIIGSLVLILTVDICYACLGQYLYAAPVLYGLYAFCCVYFVFLYEARGVAAKLLTLSVEDMNSGIMCIDKDGKCIFANDSCKKLFQAQDTMRPMEEYYAKWLEGKSVEDLKEENWKEEHEIDGEMHFYEVRFKFLLGDKGNYVGSFFSFLDRTEEIKELELERYSATHDYLTDIYNRERFFERVSQVLQDEPDVKRVIVCINIKDFKIANDLFGEETGNKILKRIAGLMRRDAGEDTLYCRLEADRFAMCMREENFVEEDYPDYLAELKKIVNSSVYRLHAHVGVYHIDDPKLSVSVMCDKAFVAIESIKESYQQIVSHYTDKMGRSDQMEKVMIGEFDRALNAGEFQMFLQPQVAVDGYGILGAEALVRWEHPVRGMISPGEFIPVFEKSGYITRLDNYMWELACRQLRTWKDQGIDNIHISVNISPMDFYLIDIYDTFTSLVERYGIDPVHLKLEITETALMEDISKHLALIDRLRNYGFHVEIDDFGSGYSSLNTLQDIQVDVLKLDMGFLRKTDNQGRSRIIMNAVIDMSKNLGFTIVTEGVETEEQVDYLTQAGCDIFQGYFFAKPMPVKDFESKYFVGGKVGKA